MIFENESSVMEQNTYVYVYLKLMGHIVQMFKTVLLLCAAWLHDTKYVDTICATWLPDGFR